MNAALWETQSNAILIKNLWGFHCPSKYRHGSPAGGFYYKWHYLMPLVTSDSFVRTGNAGLHPHAAKYRPAWRAEDGHAEAWQSRSSHLATAMWGCQPVAARGTHFSNRVQILKTWFKEPGKRRLRVKSMYCSSRWPEFMSQQLLSSGGLWLPRPAAPEGSNSSGLCGHPHSHTQAHT